MGTTSKSPKRVLAVALATARACLPEYSHRFSPQKFTQHQLFACLVLKAFFKLNYRGVSQLLDDFAEIRNQIGLKSVPHYTTLQKAAGRLLKTANFRCLLRQTVRSARRSKKILSPVKLAAIDSSGFEATHASRYFVRRRHACLSPSDPSQTTTYRRFPKLAIVTDCASHFILSATTERGPKPDFGHFEELLRRARETVPLNTILADAGYDSESNHEYSREKLKVRTVIPPNHGRPTTKLPTARYRRLMATKFQKEKYGQRWQVETAFSVIKRTQGECVQANKRWSQVRALYLKVLAHNLMLLRLNMFSTKQDARFFTIVTSQLAVVIVLEWQPLRQRLPTSVACTLGKYRSQLSSRLSMYVVFY